MIVFCPNCGTQNSGLAGARASCAACGSTFDVPADAAPRSAPTADPAPPPPDAPRAASFSAPGAQVFGPAMVPVRTGARGTNTMAIISLVAGLICCIPIASPAVAIGCGVGAIKQLDANRDAEGGRALAIIGIVLGVLSGLFQVLGFLSSLSRRF